jgi:lipid-A-disaccharide synthase
MKKILMVAGEASGDLYGARLINALMEQSKESLYVFGVGGAKMFSAGLKPIADLSGDSGTGLDPLKKFSLFARVFRRIVIIAKNEKPDIAVMIDLPDFNLRLAKELKRLNIKVVYYISPQVWAWRGGRIKTIAKYVDKMLVIFGFEEALYKKANIPVAFVGHPLLDILEEAKTDKKTAKEKLGFKEMDLIIGLLPGSRKNEVARHLPIMLKAGGLIRKQLPDIKFVIGCAPDITNKMIETYNDKVNPDTKCRDVAMLRAKPVFNRTYEVMQGSDLLITASGTATVEAAIFNTPMIVIYKVSLVTASIFGPLIKTPYYAMVNLIAGKRIVPELMQSKANPDNLAKEAIRLLKNENLKEMAQELSTIRGKLGVRGASKKAAEEILGLLPDAG